MPIETQVQEEKTLRTEYAFINTRSCSIRKYASRDEWLNAGKELGVSPSDKHSEVSGITGFAANEHHVIGKHGAGYFILDIDDNRLDTWEFEASWARAVLEKTRLHPHELTNPKSRFVQTRDPAVVYAYVGLVVVFFGNGVFHGWRRSQKAPAEHTIAPPGTLKQADDEVSDHLNPPAG